MGSVVFNDRYQITGVGTYEQNVRIDYTEVYDLGTNRSAITITDIYIASEYQPGIVPIYGTVKINGETVKTLGGAPSHTANISGGGLSNYRRITNSDADTIYVDHNELGAATMTVSLTGGMNNVFGARYNSKMFGIRVPTSQSVPLTTHPRASTIASVSSPVATLGTLSLAVNRNSPAFFHKATFKKDNTVLYTSAAFATALSYTVPRSWFSAYPSLASLPVTVSVQTYTDETCTTTIGSPAEQTITVNADAGMKPNISSGWAALSYYNTGTGAAGITGYVKGYSKAEATFDSTKIDMTDAVGATIASYSVVCQGASVSASPYRTPVLASTSVPVVCTVTDTRGRTASETFTLTVMDYAVPVLTGQEVFRCDVNGDPNDNGSYFSIKATVTCSSLGGQNTCSLTAAIAAAGGSYGTEHALTSGTASVIGTVSADASYVVRITATDGLGNTAVYYSSVPTRKWAMKFRSNGRGVAFGKAPESDDKFEVTADWEVKFGTPLGISSGGTGASTASGAKSNLGLGNVENERQYSAQNPPPYPVTSVNGQTGAVTIPTGSQATLLWTNPSPTSNMGASTIPLDLSDYTWVCVKTKVSATGTSRTPDYFFSVDDVIHYIYLLSVSQNRTGGRTFQYDPVNKEVSFGAGNYNAAANNAYAIPLEIWGLNL